MIRQAVHSMVLGVACCATAIALGFTTGSKEASATVVAQADDTQELVVYSGRSESLVAPVIEMFEAKTGVKVKVKYGSSAEIAALLLEEGSRTPASIFFAQDAGALGSVAHKGMCHTLPSDVLSLVDSKFQSPKGDWVGITGRARTVVYNTKALTEDQLPESILEFTNPEWKGRLAWAPTNGSFQAFVTAMRVKHGDAETAAWLKGIQANEPKVYPKNSAIVRAVGAGEADLGFVNHYYLHRFLAKDKDFPAKNYYLKNGDTGALVNVAGVAMLKHKGQTAQDKSHAEWFVQFLLSEEAQTAFATETYEYPLVATVKPSVELLPLDQVQSPEIDLSDLEDLNGTLDLLRSTGVLP